MKSKLNSFTRFLHREKYRAGVSILAIIGVVLLYLTGRQYPPGVLSYIAAMPALIGVIITALARVNDIGHDRSGWSWQLRRIGLSITGATAVAYLYAPFSTVPVHPTWIAVLGWWGFFITWLTTPGMPPWHKYIFSDMPMSKERNRGD